MTIESPSRTGEPYRVRLHYDPTAHGVHVGRGEQMSPVCGQRAWIGTTDDPAQVECLKCKRLI